MNVFVHGSPVLNSRASRALEREIERLAGDGCTIHIVDEFTSFYSDARFFCGETHARTDCVRRIVNVKSDDIWKVLIERCDEIVFIAHRADCKTLLQTRQYAREMGKNIRVLYGNEAEV